MAHVRAWAISTIRASVLLLYHFYQFFHFLSEIFPCFVALMVTSCFHHFVPEFRVCRYCHHWRIRVGFANFFTNGIASALLFDPRGYRPRTALVMTISIAGISFKIFSVSDSDSAEIILTSFPQRFPSLLSQSKAIPGKLSTTRIIISLGVFFIPRTSLRLKNLRNSHFLN